MKVKVVAHTPDGHFPGDVIDVRDAEAEIWVKRGWAIKLPKEKKAEEPKAELPKRAVIETPEDHSAVSNRETASLKRKKK